MVHPAFITCHNAVKEPITLMLKTQKKLLTGVPSPLFYVGWAFEAPTVHTLFCTAVLQSGPVHARMICHTEVRAVPVLSDDSHWWVSLVAVHGHPLRALSQMLRWGLCLRAWAAHRCTLLMLMHLSPYTVFILQWVWIGSMFSAVRNSVTARYFSCIDIVTLQTAVLHATSQNPLAAEGCKLRQQCDKEDRVLCRTCDASTIIVKRIKKFGGITFQHALIYIF